MTTTFSKKKDQIIQMKTVIPQTKASSIHNNLMGIQKYQRGIQHKPGDSKTKMSSKCIIRLFHFL